MMDAFLQGRRFWEKNGNIVLVPPSPPASSTSSLVSRTSEKECAVRNMGDSDATSQNNSSYGSDWNSNQFLPRAEKKTEQKSLGDSMFDQYSNVKDNANKECSRKSPTSPATSPTTIFGASLHQKDLSYDDLSKNIDANLAEIDMETFRSEDINSILALPAIYSGDFQSASHGEQCASVSGSLLNGLELDNSTSNRHSEDEISICKDEPLFSPLREPHVPEATISVDSLDNSSSYDQDLVLTCKANKNNYTIVFEGSSTQFSDDSDYQDVCRSSEGEGSLSGAVHLNCNSGFKKQSSMVQSDVAFTTWSKLWRSQRISRRKNDSHTKVSAKSQSLPNLSHNSVFITDKQLTQWAKWCGNHRFPLYEVVQNYQASGMHVVSSKECLHSVSLLKLFMKHKVSSNSSIGSSGQSDSSTSLILQPLNFRNTSLQNSLDMCENKIKPLQNNGEDVAQKRERHHSAGRNDNDTKPTQMFVDNIQILDWNSVQNFTETNNNNINSLYNTENNVPNNNNVEEIRVTSANEDCDNSQCFEDSLMDAPSPPLKHFHATPIKEEEETDVSSGDEVMRDSKNPFGSDDSTSGDITVIQNNTLDNAAYNNRQENSGSNLERINNIFPCKSNVGLVNKAFRDEQSAAKKPGVPTENQSQSTQTKQFNINDCSGPEIFKPLQAFSCKTSSNQTDCDTVNTVHYATSRDSSPASSGYVSSRHSSVERLRPSSQGNAVNHNVAVPPAAAQKSNVVLTTTCSCGTQIPVHVKDSSVQTSTLYNSNSSSGFTFKESTLSLPEPNRCSQTSVKSPLQNVASQTKSNQKDKKSIYVCYPNYSLPDLSFLRSVIEENSESVFLTPVECKLPQDLLKQKKPKSYGAYESILQKHLTKIKDWESLNVLLPDDLKILISKTHSKAMKTHSAPSRDTSCSKMPQQNLSSSFCSADDAMKSKTNLSDGAYKRHMPRSILRKSNSVEQCEDRQCRVHVPTRCTSASSVICGKESSKAESETLRYKQGFSDGLRTNTHCGSSKCTDCIAVMKSETPLKKHHHNMPSNISPDFLLTADLKHNPCSNYKSPPLFVQNPEQNPDKKPGYSFENCRDDNLLQDLPGKNVPYSCNSENMLSACDQKAENQSLDSHCYHGKKAVKFCEKSPTKSSKHLDACKMGRCCSCDTQNRSPSDFHSSQCSCDICNLESDKPPQEFLVSPTQNSLLYPDISDSYALQNFSGGGKFFQEALRRKTGLVENLRKATQIIFEHHKASGKKGVDSGCSFSMGQKILTWLCPAVHTILSDGLLPSVQGFFGPLPNSPWKVAGASIKQGETRKDVEELLNQVNSEKLLTDSTYRFNAFIIGLLNLGCFEWWLGHLCACQSLICHHYHPTALLSLLALPAAVHLRHELKELVSPLSNLSFNLDIVFETKVTSGENWKKYSEGNVRPVATDLHCESKSPREQEERNTCDLNLQFSPYKQAMSNKINDFSLKTKHSQAVSPCNNLMNIRSDADECHDNQVWPGITINPFPNAKFADDFNLASQHKKEKSQSGRLGMPLNFLKDTLLPRDPEHCGRKNDIPHFSLCSSTDSGCSSQIDHANHSASPATAGDESPNVDVKEGQQFKMLRQKWEKISHGMNKHAVNKTPSPLKTTATKPTISSSSKAKKKTEVSPPRSLHTNKDFAVPKTPTKTLAQTPPSRRAQTKMNVFTGASNEGKSLAPDVVASSQVPGEIYEKRKSQIPMLKFNKNSQIKSMIPVQKTNTRARSANRDARFSSD